MVSLSSFRSRLERIERTKTEGQGMNGFADRMFRAHVVRRDRPLVGAAERVTEELLRGRVDECEPGGMAFKMRTQELRNFLREQNKEA